MKVLIVSSPRTGGTNFSIWLSSELNLMHISEPLNGWRNSKKIDNFWENDNICAKINPWECSTDIQDHFDKTILLIRKNKKDQAISLLRAEETESWNSIYHIGNEWIEKNHSKIKEYENIVNKYTQMTLEWKRTNNMLLNYEDIYYNFQSIEGELKKYLFLEGIFNHKWILDNSKRYRKSESIEKRNIL